MQVQLINFKKNSYIYLVIWIVTLISISTFIGWFTNTGIDLWYKTLNRSTLTPPNYVFPIIWTILYTLIAIYGWFIWQIPECTHLKLIKNLYVQQLILNWSWSPLFFYYHLTGVALLILVVMDLIVGAMMYFTDPKIKFGTWLILPYLLWILFATYLNFYIWKFN